MKNKKLTITIGIPAHNEEKNIKNMIESVLKQNGESFILEKILVVLDGCTDNTLRIVKSIAKKDIRIKVVFDSKRTGKATRLNQIYKLNKSQLIGTFDADILLERDCELEIMVKEFLRNKKINVVAARQYPVPSNTWMGKFSDASFIMLQTASMMWRNGNNVHSLQGSASLIDAKFAKSFKFPSDIVTDAGYIYLKSIKKGRYGFVFTRDTKIIFRSVSTFTDWRKLGVRTLLYNKRSIYKYFGKKGIQEYFIPRRLIYLGILSVFFKDPLGCIGAIILNLFIRFFPLNLRKRKLNIWETAKSSKLAIKI